MQIVLKLLRRLFARRDPLKQPCGCGRDATVLLSSEREEFLDAAAPYCLSCLAPVLRRAVSQSTDRWLAVQPFRGAPCYVPFTLGEISDFEAPEGWPQDLAALLSGLGARCDRCAGCGRCGGVAGRWGWVTTAETASLADLQNEPQWFRNRAVTDMCETCVADAVLDSMRERRIKLYELVLPTAGPGVWLPWGY